MNYHGLTSPHQSNCHMDVGYVKEIYGMGTELVCDIGAAKTETGDDIMQIGRFPMIHGQVSTVPQTPNGIATRWRENCNTIQIPLAVAGSQRNAT